ncbi:Fcf1-domain-containing protein [Glomus cerebriforme]|uniref:U three protein 23 n=1 Tax=Glomus cerebriforme TaxID=658196 RepID=A0A397SLB8_9GLOM|nr:Fcf1-domain-containing protein [Glomus cerebriforme]
MKMRQKRTKQYKRLMTLYSNSFGFREPYQILVDGDFMRTALRYKMDISRQLCIVMLGKTKQLYTSCTLAEVKERDNDEFGTATALMKFERRGCIHRHKPISSAECLLSIIEDNNPHNYCIATQNESLRERFRAVPGVPLLYINRSVLIIEPPSYATLQKAKQVENSKTHASVEELSFLKKANSDMAKKQAEAVKPKKKRKGPKEPNPLSCKKKKMKVITQKIKKSNEIGKVEQTKEPTNNKRKRDDYGNNDDSQSEPQENYDEKPSTDNGNQLNKKKRKRKKKKSKKAEQSGKDASTVCTNNINKKNEGDSDLEDLEEDK